MKGDVNLNSSLFSRNQEIRIYKGKLPFWIIAERLGVSENTLLNWMRKELPEDKKAEILRVIDQIKGEVDQHNSKLTRKLRR